MKNIIGIVRETKNEFERRVPLNPNDVAELVQKHLIKVNLQRSDLRIFPAQNYINAGATTVEDLSGSDVLLGIKEVKIKDLLAGKVYLYFSHVIKGQEYNMPMLQRLLDLKCTLIDYERIADEQGQRLIFFSVQAGIAGIIDTLWAFGKRMDWEGIQTPFAEIKQTWHYDGLAEAEQEIKKVGEKIKRFGLPEAVSPLVIGIAGYGNVAKGVQQILDLLPFEEIQPEDLASLTDRKKYSHNCIYKVVFKEEHMVKPIAPGQPFELQDYYDHPEKYKSVFASYLPWFSIFVNATYWSAQYPRFVTKENLKELYRSGQPKMRVIGDITCDIDGGVEATVKATDPGNPVFVYEPQSGKPVDGWKGNGPVIMAVDILPSEMPKDASNYFSSVLKRFIPVLAETDFTVGFDELQLPAELKKAVIVYRGELTPDYKYLTQYLEK